MKYEKLKQSVERTLGHELRTAADYNLLSQKISKRFNEQISTTTLKRILGYLDDGVKPRQYTLDLVARFVGYRNYKEFETSDGESQSNEILSRKVSCKDLNLGQRICVTWQPDRSIVIEYKGEGLFEVLEALNTKLSIGDTFVCHLIIEHEPLYVDRLIHNDQSPVCFVAGKVNGIMFEFI